MNGNGGKKPTGWSSKQSWFKDVLSKSGTELLKICNSKNKKNNEKETKDNKMVYYQSTPLIVKTEQQSSQVQFCTQTAASPTTTTTNNTTQSGNNLTPYYQNAQDTKTLNYCELNGVRAEIITPQQQQQQQQQSINNSQLHNLNNIKLELLPPGITFFAKNTSPISTVTTTATTPPPSSFNNEPVASKTLTTLTNVPTTQTGTTTGAIKNTSVGRRNTNNNGVKPQFKCEQCGMTFGSKSAHTSHTKSHAKSNALMNGTSQDLQTNEFNETSGLPLGIPKTPQIKPFANGVTAGDPYQCNVCQKTFAVPARLIRHYRTHTGERPFECEFCHKLFSVKENLQVHRRIHTKERPYKCDVCGRAFEHSGKLHRHMRIHTGERPHKCNVCEKTFIQSGQLVIHMRTHTGEKPYKCPVEGCGKGFTCSKQLKVHSRTHTGEKPYHCDICFRDFGYNHVLKLHRVQHYGSKCYKCTICDETFKSKKEMEAHIKGHANEMPDDEEEAANTATSSTQATAPSSSASLCSASSLSSNGDFNSAPASPQSPTSTNVRVSKPRKQKALKTELRTPSPSSPSSTMSPPSSMASVSRISAGSPMQLETDQYSRDSGLASSAASVQNNRGNGVNFEYAHYTQKQSQQVSDLYMEELPTDLSKPHAALEQTPTTYYTQPESQSSIANYEQAPTYLRLSPANCYYQSDQRSQCMSPDEYVMPTINPALLEAASIASERAMYLEEREEEITQAALQIMKLKQPIHIHAPPPTITVSSLSPSQKSMLAASEAAQYDDTREANELIERYKRGDLAAHGIHKRTAPVPKFESSFLNNEIVRQVEAAIAPLRASTESPERSSSPESDSMLMQDRHCLTLPLRKRKLRPLSPSNVTGSTTATKDISDLANEQKVMRLNSVIQFAKAS